MDTYDNIYVKNIRKLDEDTQGDRGIMGHGSNANETERDR